MRDGARMKVTISRAVPGDIRQAGYKKVMLWVFADNARARGFYEAQGFAANGIVKPNLEPKEICYEKKL